MDHSDWERVKAIFHAVHQESGPERERRLDELCRGDDALRAQVFALLVADEDAESLLDSRELDDVGMAALTAGKLRAEGQIEGPGDRIGPYKLLQEIGEGGFGVVYMAEQEAPIRRRVALKVVKPGMDTKQVIARFEAERQALAMMDHPNIAKVFEAGTTPSGRPFFVMELVRGIPITDYCDDHKLDTRERLELFVDVCRAVQHAHQAGIIHRDLKPSNVLVTLHDGTPVPKVIDFGVAKATRARLTESTLFTEFHQFIGTPTYMSPEQAAYEGLEVDPRSDVYSLGVLLYELLTGTTPFDSVAMKRAAYFEVLRILKEEEPPKPSTRVSTIGSGSDQHAKHRRSDPSTLARMLRGDLDWIVMKALEKDRGRRYDSATELAADIIRYFEQRPIEARAPSRLYRARKLFRRRRGRFAAAAVILLALFVDIGYVTWQRNEMPTVTTPPPGPVGARSELLLTSDEHYCFFDAQPSPSGDRIAYTDICDRPGIYVVDTGSDDERLISQERFYWGMAWSPDGERIIAGRQDGADRRPEIFDLEGGDVVSPPALAGISLAPVQWSSDGERISGEMVRRDGNVSSVVVSLTSGEVVTLAEGVRQGQGAPAFSPDGRFVVFGDVTDDTERLFVLELETGERWLLTGRPGVASDALWSPDGLHIVFQDPTGLWAQPVTNGRATGGPRLVRRGRHWPGAWTEHGYYYTVENSVTQGYRIPVDVRTGRSVDEWESLALPISDLHNIRFQWAPDMRRAAVAGWGDGMIHIVEGERVTSLPIGLEVLPSKLWWSADGREVLFTSPPRAQRDRSRRAISALDVGDGTIRRLYEPTDVFGNVHLSPDGRTVVSLRIDDRQRTRLVVSALASPEGEVFAGGDVGAGGNVLAADDELGGFMTSFGQPLFDPSGQHVLYLRRTDVSTSIWVVGTDGSGERRLAEASGIVAPHWDPTGRMIAFQTWEVSDGKPHLRVVSLDGAVDHEIEGFSELADPWLLDWSPDGASLAVRETVGRKELWRTGDLLGSGGS